MQGHGPGDQQRRAHRGPDRLGRRQDSGGRSKPGGLCRHLSAQRPFVGGNSTDLRNTGPRRRGRDLLPRPDRFRLHGRRHRTDVHYGAGCHQVGDGRRGHPRRVGWRRQPLDPERRRAFRHRVRRAVPLRGQAASRLPGPEQHGGPPTAAVRG